MLEESQAARARGAEHWWRGREAATLGLFLGAEHFGQAAGRKKAKPLLSAERLYAELLLPDCAPESPPLLRARALCTAARFGADVPTEAAHSFLQAALAALAPTEPALLRLAACRAITSLSMRVEPEVVAPAVGVLLPPVAALLSVPSEDAALLVLETLACLVRRDAAASAAAEPWLTPALLQLWSARTEEQLTASAVVDVCIGLAQSAAALPGLVSRLLPALAQVLQLQEAADSSP